MNFMYLSWKVYLFFALMAVGAMAWNPVLAQLPSLEHSLNKETFSHFKRDISLQSTNETSSNTNLYDLKNFIELLANAPKRIEDYASQPEEKNILAANLQLTSAITVNPTPIVCNRKVTITATVRNIGNTAFEGFVLAQLLDQGGNFLDYIDFYVPANTIAPNATATLTFEQLGLDYASGTYSIQLAYLPFDGDAISIIQRNGFTNPINSTINCPTGGSTCVIPSGLQANDIGYSYVELGWNRVTGATSYQTRYRTTGSIWLEGSTPTSPRFIWVDGDICTEYEYQVRTVCADGSVSKFSESIFVTTEGCDDLYCYADGLAGDNWINQIQFENNYFISGNNFGYENFTGEPISVQRGQSYTVNLTPGGKSSRNSENAYWRVWIDLNQDDDFLDDGEQVFQAIANNFTAATGNFILPISALSGETRMRITMSLDGYADPCSATGVRETEDYRLTIQESSPTLTVNPSALNFTNASSSQTVAVTSNVNWATSENLDWVSVSPSSSTNNSSITIRVTENTSTSSRSGNITISGGGVSRTISVNQSGQTNALTVSPSSINVGSTQTTQVVTLTANTTWSVSESLSWLSVSPTSGTLNAQLTIRIDGNTSTNNRSGNITVTGGGISRTIAVSQSGVTPMLTVSNSDLSFPASGGNLQVSVNANITWTVTNTNNWLSVTPTNGNNNALITIQGLENTTTALRTGTITVQGSGITRTITVTQEGRVASSCTAPTNVEVGLIDYVYAAVLWDSIPNVLLYESRVRPVGTTTWQEIPSIPLTFQGSSVTFLTQLTPCTNYEVQVRHLCTSGEISDYSPTYLFRTSGCGERYCYAYGAYDIFQSNWIDRVTLGTIDYESGKHFGYGNFTNRTTTLQKGNTNTISLTPGADEGNVNIYWRVWIDYNQDGDFSDTGEQVYQAVNLASTIVSGNFIVPSTALNGNTRMRVSMSLGNYSAPCSTGGEREVEDYTVNIQGQTPSLVINPERINLPCEGGSRAVTVTANVNWTVTAIPNWLTTSTISGNNNGVVTFTASTNPSDVARSANIIISTSGITRVVTITQDGCPKICNPPTLRLTEVNYLSVAFTWNAVESATGYKSRIRSLGQTDWSESNTFSSPGFTWFVAPCTIVEIQVQTICADGSVSDYSPTLLATTQGCSETYCLSYGNTNEYWINRVQLNTINNTSGTNFGYGNYTNLSTTLDAGKSYQLLLTPGTTLNSTTLYWRIWIDYNRDNDFNDSGELVMEMTGSSLTTLSRFFSIPNSALRGATRMRVSMSVGRYATACENTNTNLEVEDYTVQIQGEPARLTVTPNTLNFNSESSTQFFNVASNVNWNATPNANWISVVPNSGSNNASVSVTVQANSSTAAREAVIQVTANGTTPQNVLIRQAGKANCASPTNVFVEDAGLPFLYFNWDAVPEAVGYQSRIKISGSSEWIEGPIYPDRGVIWGNLIPCQQYDFQIRTVCNDNELSPYVSLTASTLGCEATYCYAYGLAWEDWINRVQLNQVGPNIDFELVSINNLSGPDYGYGDYTNISAILQQGQQYQLFLEPNFVQSVKNVVYQAWIDYNQDGDFDDAQENIMWRTSTNEATAETIFTIPNNALNGATRMRLIMSLNQPANACSVGEFREVEDYTVILQGTSAALEVNRSVLNFSESGGNSDVQVVSNTNWRVTKTEPWITLNKESGNNNSLLNIGATVNPNIASRSGEVIISGNGGVTARITVNQAGQTVAPTLNVNPTNLEFTSGTELKELVVTSNVAWQIVSAPAWLNISTQSGINNAVIRVVSDRNALSEDRIGQIVFRSGNIDTKVEVRQIGKNNTNVDWNAKPGGYNVGSEANCVTFELISIFPWQAKCSSNCSWITSITPNRGNSSANIEVCFSSNNSSQARRSVIKFNDQSGIREITVYIEQAGKSSGANLAKPNKALAEDFILAVAPNPTADIVHAQVHLPVAQTVQFTITDMRGRVVHQRTENLAQGDQHVTFEGFDTGMYLLQGVMEDGTTTRSLFVVQQ